MKSIIFAVFVFSFLICGAWIAGFDFDERGRTAFLVYFWSIGLSFAGYLFAEATK